MQSGRNVNRSNVLFQFPLNGIRLPRATCPLTNPRIWFVVFGLRDNKYGLVHDAEPHRHVTHGNDQRLPYMPTPMHVLVEHGLARQYRITLSPSASKRSPASEQLVHLKGGMAGPDIESVGNKFGLNKLRLGFVNCE
jgi:hypothetical protein